MVLQILQDPGAVIDRDKDRLHDSFLQHPVLVQYIQHALSAENNLGLRKDQLSLFRPGFMASGPDTDQPEVLPAFPDVIFIRIPCHTVRIPGFPVFTHTRITQSGLQNLLQRHG